jgi:hypothetical protein
VTGVPYLIDVDIGDIAAVVGFVEGNAVWNMGGGFYLDHGKDRRVVVAAQRGVFYTEQPGEAGSGNGEAFPIPEIKRDFFESETDDISVGECERIITAIVWSDPHQRLCSVVLLDAKRASPHRRQLVTASEEDGEAVP